MDYLKYLLLKKRQQHTCVPYNPLKEKIVHENKKIIGHIFSKEFSKTEQ